MDIAWRCSVACAQTPELSFDLHLPFQLLAKEQKNNVCMKTISSHLKDAYSIRQKSSNPLFLFWPLNNIIITCNCQRGNRAKKRGWLGGRIITPRNVGKNSQILRNPLRFAFLAIFGCKQDPIFRWQNLTPAEKVTRSSRPDYRPWRVTPPNM